MVTEDAGDLGGGRAGTLGNRRPVISQRLLAVRGGGVVPGLVPPPVLDRVRQPPVELHYYSVLLVHAVPAAAPPVRCRERNLPTRLRQSVRSLHVPVIAVLQHRMITRNGRLEDLVQVSAPAQPPALGHGRLQRSLVGKVPRDRPRHPPAHIVEAPRRLRQVQHRLLHRRPRRKFPLLHRIQRPVGPVHADPLGRDDMTSMGNSHMNRVGQLVSKALELGGRLVAENRAWSR
jgi:hypothetical protein